MQTALRHGFLALGMLLLGACGSAPPPYQYENNDTLALESIATEGAPVDDLYEYPQLMSMEDGGMAESSAPDFYEPPRCRKLPQATTNLRRCCRAMTSASCVAAIARAPRNRK